MKTFSSTCERKVPSPPCFSLLNTMHELLATVDYPGWLSALASWCFKGILFWDAPLLKLRHSGLIAPIPMSGGSRNLILPPRGEIYPAEDKIYFIYLGYFHGYCLKYQPELILTEFKSNSCHKLSLYPHSFVSPSPIQWQGRQSIVSLSWLSKCLTCTCCISWWQRRVALWKSSTRSCGERSPKDSTCLPQSPVLLSPSGHSECQFIAPSNANQC